MNGVFCASFVYDSSIDYRTLRTTKESRTLVHFSIALIGLYVVTILAYVKDMPEEACKAWAVSMVYFFNVALFWSFVKALLLMIKQKMATFGSGFLTRNCVLIATPFAWGMYILVNHVSSANSSPLSPTFHKLRTSTDTSSCFSGWEGLHW